MVSTMKKASLVVWLLPCAVAVAAGDGGSGGFC